jgi:long-chain acyl-CoA synthetase
MMGKSLASAAVMLSLLFATANAAEVAGVRLDDHSRLAGSELLLNGAGLRSKLFFKVYVIGIYAPHKTTKAAELIDVTEPRRIAMHMLRQVEADSLLSALKEGLQQNHSEAELTAMKPQIERLEAIMRAIGTAKPGDLITLDLTAAATTVSFNGQDKGSIAGASFGAALLKIWLGGKPIDETLKQALLGG